MNWDDARLFLAIARDGQMLAAARKIGTSQARLSRRIAALEQQVGARLLERTTRGSTLTDDGQLLFEAAERMEAEMAESLSLLQGRRETIGGTLRIAAPDGLGSAFIAPRLGRLSSAYPDLNIQLVSMPRSFSLSQREADIAVMVGRPQKGRLRTRRLTDYTLGCYASRAYLAGRRVPVAPEDLAEHDLVGYVEDMIPTADLAYASEIWRPWRSRIEITTATGQLQAVRNGAGIGILHDFLSANDTDLVPVLPDRVITRTYWMAWHENMRVARRVRVAADFLFEQVQASRTLFCR